jgi:hypothetical protein
MKAIGKMWRRLTAGSMSKYLRVGLVCGLVGTCCQLRADEVSNKDRSAAELLPESVVATVEIPKLGEIAALVWDHPLRQQLAKLPAYEAVLQSDQFKKFQQGVNAFESAMGQPWLAALKTLTDDGVTLALDAKQGSGVALLIRSSDRAAIEKLSEFVLALRLLTGGGKLVKQADYRGLTAHALNDEIKMVVLDRYLLLTNRGELGKAIVDRYLEPEHATLQSAERYQQALVFRQAWQDSTASEAPPTVAMAYLDLQAMRHAGIAKQVYQDRSGNYFGELLLGGLLTSVRHAPFADVRLQLSNAGLQLNLATEHQRNWESPREYTFGAPELAAAAPLVDLPNRLFALSAHRDMSQMWLRAGELLTEKAEEQLAQADTQLTTLLSGHDFGEDILGTLGSEVRLVAQVQDFTEQLPRPAIQLPSFALEFPIEDSSESQGELRRIFQSFIGFLNVTGATNGLSPIDLGMEKLDGAQYYTGTFVPNRNERESVKAPIYFNFSPTLAFADGRLILSSTTALARELAQFKPQTQPLARLDAADADRAQRPVNTTAVLEVDSLRAILKANESQLVANNMLEQGHTQEEAAAEVGLLLDLVDYLRQANLSLAFDNGRMELKVAVELAQ